MSYYAYRYLVIVGLVLLPILGVAEQDTLSNDSLNVNSLSVDSLSIDSIGIDSLATTVSRDSLVEPEYFVPFSRLNSWREFVKPNKLISKYDVTFLSGGDMSELIADRYNINYLTPGHWSFQSDLRLSGELPGYQGLGVNGVQLISPTGTSVNLNQFSADQFESVEIYTGSKAAVLAENSQVFINYQTRVFNTATPFTQISYFDAGENYISGDGLISQNILPNQNTTFGFKSFGGGSEYENQILDHMNIFLNHRINLSNLSSLSVSYYYINQYFRDNGGLQLSDYSNPYADAAALEPETADYLSPSYSFRELNHIIQLSYIGSLTPDTTSVFQSNVTFNYNDYQPQYLDTVNPNPFFPSNLLSTRNTLSLELDFADLVTGFDGRLNATEKEDTYQYGFSPFGYLDLTLGKFAIAGGARANISNLYTNLNFGANTQYSIDSTSSLAADISVNNINQLSPYSSLSQFTVTTVSGEYQISNSSNSLGIEAYFHDYSTFEEILSIASSEAFNIIGGKINFTASLLENLLFNRSRLILTGSVNVEQFAILDEPSISSQLEISEEITVQKSVARIGIRARYLRNQNPFFFDSFSQLYFFNQYQATNTFLLDAIISAKLGNANIRLMLENILGQRYLPVIPYPNRGTNFRIHLTWAFPFN